MHFLCKKRCQLFANGQRHFNLYNYIFISLLSEQKNQSVLAFEQHFPIISINWFNLIIISIEAASNRKLNFYSTISVIQYESPKQRWKEEEMKKKMSSESWNKRKRSINIGKLWVMRMRCHVGYFFLLLLKLLVISNNWAA